jgi:hypothetical protein
MTPGEMVQAYLQLRNKKDAIKGEAEQKTKLIDAALDKLETAMQKQMEALGVNSLKSEHGTVFVTTTDYASVADWDAVLDFIQKGHFNLLNKAVNKIAVREYIEQTKTVPPGVNYGTKVGLNVRKPSASAE